LGQKLRATPQGLFEAVVRGLGCAPGSSFLCLASSPPPSARPARAKSSLSVWLPWYAIFHRSARARLGTTLGGRFSSALRFALAREKGNFLPPFSVAKTMAYKGQRRRLLSSSSLAHVRYQLEFGYGVRRAPIGDRRASSPFSRSGSAPTRRRASLPRWDSGRCGSSSSVPALT
jgi:hypothetical protein